MMCDTEQWPQPRRQEQPQERQQARRRLAPYRLSRRTMLGLAAMGVLASCAPSRESATRATPAATPTPTPLAPKAALTPANAGEIKQLAMLQPQDGRVRGCAWSPDGRILAAGGDQDIHLWDVKQGGALGPRRGHRGQIYGMAWSPDGKMLASASSDGTVRLWGLQSEVALATLHDPSAIPVSVAWSPDSTRVASGTFDGYVLVWDATTGKQVARWSGPPMEGRGLGGNAPFAVWGVSWSSDGRAIVSTRYDGYLQIWDVASGHDTVLRKTGDQPNGVAWSPDGATFATADDHGVVQLWNAASHANTGTFGAHPLAGWAYAVAWSPDGTMVATSRESGILQIWGVRDGRELAVLEGHDSPVWGLAWSPEDMRLASASDDGTVRLWGVP